MSKITFLNGFNLYHQQTPDFIMYSQNLFAIAIAIIQYPSQNHTRRLPSSASTLSCCHQHSRVCGQEGTHNSFRYWQVSWRGIRSLDSHRQGTRHTTKTHARFLARRCQEGDARDGIGRYRRFRRARTKEYRWVQWPWFGSPWGNWNVCVSYFDPLSKNIPCCWIPRSRFPRNVLVH